MPFSPTIRSRSCRRRRAISAPLDKWPRFDLISPLTQVVKGAYQDKATIESALSKVYDLLNPLAQTEGYIVVTK